MLYSLRRNAEVDILSVVRSGEMLSRGTNPRSSGIPFTTATPSTNDPLLKKSTTTLDSPTAHLHSIISSHHHTATPLPLTHPGDHAPSRTTSHKNPINERSDLDRPRDRRERRLPSNMCSARLGLSNASS
ncbi:hypothetical protein M422DRAFT_25828 [Sphaerobolus stellatus SS14]|nr:hypothetical protein M422DRAFT_25828 [Sphaerobolus stellatus SS14]